MGEAELYKLAEKFDEDFSPADIDLSDGLEKDFNKNFVESVEKQECPKAEKKKTKKHNGKFKEEYFSFYDDIKTSSNHKTEW
ncbi:MAG: hypothetical protein IJS68_04045 [Clostridia bacterium]|nr:hypothetical protein [Clostridia bacterium]